MLEAQQLAARRGHTRLFSNLSFRLEAGETLLVTGPNGSGKTTLLRLLAGLSAPASGTLSWEGRAIEPFDPGLRAAAAFAGHLPALKDELTTEENLAALVGLAAADVEPAAVREALDRVALTPQRQLPARVLSQGQRRRIGLARLMLVRRVLWLLDEPLTALDAAAAALLSQLVGEHVRTGGLAIAATHAPLDLAHGRTRSMVLA